MYIEKKELYKNSCTYQGDRLQGTVQHLKWKSSSDNKGNHQPSLCKEEQHLFPRVVYQIVSRQVKKKRVGGEVSAMKKQKKQPSLR